MKSDWEQIFSGLQESLQYSSRHQQSCSLGCFPLISNSSSPFFWLLVTVSSAPTRIGITLTLMFNNFFSSLAKIQVFVNLLAFFYFHYGSPERQNPRDVNFSSLVFFLLLMNIKSGGLVRNWWSVCISKLRKFYASHSQVLILICVYTIRSYGQISISCTIHSRSSFPPSHIW